MPDDQSIGEFDVIPGSIIHVSAVEGNNGGDGSEAQPYKTISYALSRARPSDVLYVHAGRYNRELGERFPLEVGDGVRVEGYGAVYDIRSDSSRIVYSSPGDSALALGDGSSVSNMGVYVDEDTSNDGKPAIGIYSSKTSNIEEMVVAGFGKGVSLDGGMNGEFCPSIRDSSISACETGIEVRGNNTNAEIVDNYVSENTVAIDMLANANRVVSNMLVLPITPTVPSGRRETHGTLQCRRLITKGIIPPVLCRDRFNPRTATTTV